MLNNFLLRPINFNCIWFNELGIHLFYELWLYVSGGYFIRVEPIICISLQIHFVTLYYIEMSSSTHATAMNFATPRDHISHGILEHSSIQFSWNTKFPDCTISHI